MARPLTDKPGFLPPDHPLFQRGAYLVGVNKLNPSTSDTGKSAEGEPQTQAKTEPETGHGSH